jgi:murein L,D-transpeptidase YcbB/YkuD
MMAALIRFAMVNPYWNVPPDLVQVRIAPSVISSGSTYLDSKRYQVLSDWSEKATLLDPADVDWKAVAAGREELAVRQLPGGDNAMGKMKFMFPNELGVYLHDTPEKHLFREADRQFSSGCVRVEDAQRLAAWLFGKPLAPQSERPEQRVDLPEPVPVIITYLTAVPEDGRIAYRPDRYNRDAIQMARLGSRSLATR